MREVAVEDLLGREPVRVNMDEIYRFIKDKVILVTGGGGSIGSELCRQIAKHEPKQLIVFDIYENNAHAISLELKDKYPHLNLTVLIGSVRDSRRIGQVFETYKPDVVYHAAAHKHVPLMEDSPCESIKNNAIGTYKTAYAAMMNGCKRFVLISTDKAVNPTNIMGASKRLCEMIVQSFDKKIREGNAGDLMPLHVHSEDTYGTMEGMKTTPNHLIHIGKPIDFDTDGFLSRLPSLMKAAYDGEDDTIRDLVAEMVDTYRPAGEHGSEYKGRAYAEQMKSIEKKELTESVN